MTESTLIYHITHQENLESILRRGGLWCKSRQQNENFAYLDISHQGIQDRRATTMVHCGAGGYLHDYVPFYFAPRSPMLGAIHTRNVKGYTGGQAEVLHLVSSAQRIQAADVAFVFTDGHATVRWSQFYTDLVDLKHIDWEVMQDRYWRDTPEDPDRKRRRQAEFLIHQFCPLDTLIGVATYNKKTATAVQSIFESHGLEMYTKARRDWYY